MTLKGKRIAVLKGGWSSEREVSLVSGKACADALRNLEADVTEIDVTRDVANQIKAANPEIVFNALHGPWGEDGKVQSVLEILEIPYTHSGVLASALAMDKEKTKIMMRTVGIDVADGKLMSRFEAAKEHPMPVPYVVKPNADGSSFGVFIVTDGVNQPPQELLADDWHCGDEVLVEEFIQGREFTCCVMGDECIGITEIKPKVGFYDYKAKYTEGGATHILNPDNIPPEAEKTMKENAVKAHKVLGCRGITRTDFRFDPETGRTVALEVNTQPGMTPLSLAPEQAGGKGMSFEDLVKWIAEDASWLR